MKTKKTRLLRVICTLLSAAILLGSVSLFASAQQSKYDMLPVIYVTGFGATTLAREAEGGGVEQVFPPSTDQILAAFKGQIPGIMLGIANVLLYKNFDALANNLGPVVERIVEPISLNEDGSSKYDIFPIVSGAANTSLASFKANDMLDYVPYTGSEFLDMESVGDIIGDENVFNFTYDWRMSHLDTTENFRSYVQDVLELTGAKKVNVYSISQGCMIVGEYLYRYAEDGYLKNVVFDTPVLEGSDLVTDLYALDEVDFNYGVVADLLSEILHTEFDLKEIIGILPEDTLNFALDFGLKSLVLPKVIGGIAFWDMLPASELEFYENHYLDKTNSADIISKTNEMHAGFMSHVSQTLKGAAEYGTVVSIKTCTGLPMASGTVDNSDCIVNVKYSCGAACADFGEAFAESYKQKVDGVYSVSPDRTVDLSAGYYPERTWIINRHFHGQAEWDRNSLSLIMTLLLTDGIKDAYSSYEFPQFTESCAPNTALNLSFACTNCSFLPYSGDEFAGNTLTLKNVSLKKNITIKSIEFENGSLEIDEKLPLKIKHGQSTEIDFTGEIPDGRAFDTVTVTYKTGFFAKPQTITFGITILGDYAGVIK